MRIITNLIGLIGLTATALSAPFSQTSEEAENKWRIHGGMKTKFRSKEFYAENQAKAEEDLYNLQKNSKNQEENQDAYFPYKPEVGFIPIYPEDPKLDGNRMFYWMFESQGNPDTDPLVIWL